VILKLATLFLFVLCGLGVHRSHAQAPEGTLTQSEIDDLRDAAYVPAERIRVYMRILDDRQKELDALVNKRHGADFAADAHDIIDQMGAISDELNDNLDDYARKNRDVRKVLPKLVQSTERWSTSLRAPADDPRYNIVRKVALDNLKDTRSLAQQTLTDEETYFKAHPEAAKAEKARNEDPHAPR